MNETRHVALLGCGYWGKNLARNLHELGALQLVCDPAESGRTVAAENAPGVATSSEFNDALESDDIKAVAIATPAETHFELVSGALKVGKDVFVEKPLALQASEGEQLKDLAQKHGCILMVGHLLEYHPAVVRLHELVDAGKLGNVNYIYSNRLNFGKVRTEENALWSFAPHDVAVILRLFDEMSVEVACTGGSYLTPGLADVTVSTLLFQSGRRAHIFVSWLNPFKEQKLVVMGEPQMAVFNDVAAEDKLVLYDQRVGFQEATPVLQNEGQQAIALSDDEPLRRECEHFLECVATRNIPLTDAESGVRVLRVLETCQKSLEQNGRPVSLDER